MSTRGRTAPKGVPYVFLAPAITMFVLFLLVPIGYTAYLSLRGVHISGLGLGRGARKEVFVGLANYRAVLHDGELWRSALRVLVYGGVLVPSEQQVIVQYYEWYRGLMGIAG